MDASGKKIKLSSIDFVKIYRQNYAGNAMLSEIAIEVGGAIDLNIK